MSKIDTFVPEERRATARQLLNTINALGVRHQIWKYTPHAWLALGSMLLTFTGETPALPGVFLGVILGSVGTWFAFALLIFFRTHEVEERIKKDVDWQLAYRDLVRIYPEYMSQYNQVIVFYTYLKKETILSRWFP